MNIEDRQAILKLIYEYSYAYDSNEISRFSNLFTKDSIWESPIGTARSKEEIYELPVSTKMSLLKLKLDGNSPDGR
jgi:hypothetical protein